jgi:DNA processing protein
MIEEKAYWLAWSRLSGVGPVMLKRLQEYFGDLSTAWQADDQALSQIEGIGLQTLEKINQGRSQINPEKLLIEYLEKNPHFWTPADPEYPRLLLETGSPPALLHYRGVVHTAENQGMIPIIAIVGTRQPSEYGKYWTRKIVTMLTKRGFTIISGLAAGIDAEAHTACLEAGGRTIAVFGTGVDIVYPRENKKLAENILQNGLILSEYQAGTKPQTSNFPQRNRIVAGLSRAVLVMEAPENSGALITANIANEFGRDVYVLPARLDDEKSHGCLKLINNGADIIPIKLDELWERLGAIPPLDPIDDIDINNNQLSLFSNPVDHLTTIDIPPELLPVYRAIAPEPTLFDTIVNTVNLPAGEVAGALLQLELLGAVTQLPGMRYSINLSHN